MTIKCGLCKQAQELHFPKRNEEFPVNALLSCGAVALTASNSGVSKLVHDKYRAAILHPEILGLWSADSSLSDDPALNPNIDKESTAIGCFTISVTRRISDLDRPKNGATSCRYVSYETD